MTSGHRHESFSDAARDAASLAAEMHRVVRVIRISGGWEVRLLPERPVPQPLDDLSPEEYWGVDLFESDAGDYFDEVEGEILAEKFESWEDLARSDDSGWPHQDEDESGQDGDEYYPDDERT